LNSTSFIALMLVVFHRPPLTLATYTMLGSLGSIAIAFIAPDTGLP
jgi:hypothetical protein